MIHQTILVCLLWPSLVYSYCTWEGANPYWSGSPQVEQLSPSSVFVSWDGILQREDCADSMLVKYYPGRNTNDYTMTAPLSVSTTSFVAENLVLGVSYTFQVIAREEKGLLGNDYNRSPEVIFTLVTDFEKLSTQPPTTSLENGNKIFFIFSLRQSNFTSLLMVY